MTYTLATMEVPAEVHDLIKQKLIDAGYDHALLEEDGVIMLDMTHIGLIKEEVETLSKDDIKSAYYFAIEEGQIERWSGWEEKKHLFEKYYPKFYESIERIGTCDKLLQAAASEMYKESEG